MSYICNDCQAAFDTPAYVKNGFEHAFGVEQWIEKVCPKCDSTDIDEACECPKCKAYCRFDDKLCRDCRKALHEKFSAFADELTAEEEEQLDDWLDGSSIEERKNWRI